MNIDPNREDLNVGVVGAGAMGRGIAQVAAAGGCQVKLYDANNDAAKEAAEFIGKMLKRNVEKGRMSAEDADAAIANIEVIDAMSGYADC